MTIYTDEIDENLALSPALAGAYGPVIGERFAVVQMSDAVRVQLQELDETFTLTDTTSAIIGVVFAERLSISLSQVINSHFHLTIDEHAEFVEALVTALPVELAEALAITATQLVQHAVEVAEALGLVEAISPALRYHVTLSEQIRTADALARFLSASAIDGLTVTPAMSAVALKNAELDEQITVADVLTPLLLLRVTCEEAIEIAADDAVKMIFNAELDETIEIAGAYLAPDGSFTTWAMNTRSGGVTEYQNYVFNSFARIGNKYVGAADDGLYELLGDNDAGTSIIATIRSGFAQWSGTHLGSFKAAYLAVSGPGEYVLRILTLDGKTYNYRVTAADGRNVKVNMGKGLRSRYFAFELVSTGQDFDLDTLEFIPLVKDRRV